MTKKDEPKVWKGRAPTKCAIGGKDIGNEFVWTDVDGKKVAITSAEAFVGGFEGERYIRDHETGRFYLAEPA